MSKIRTEALVGMMVLAGFVLLSFIVFGISGIYAFRPGYQLNATFHFVGILDRGSPVRYAGVKVGEVKKVEVVEAVGDEPANVRVTFFVVNGVKIFENDKISVQGTHIMSEPHIAIFPVSEGGRLLKNGDTVRGIDPIPMDDLIRQGKEIAGKINAFMANLEKSLGGFDEEMVHQFFKNSSELVASLNQIMEGNEQEVRNGLVNLNKATNELHVLLEKVNRGEGTLGKLVVEDEIYRDLREFVQEIKKHPWRLFKK